MSLSTELAFSIGALGLCSYHWYLQQAALSSHVEAAPGNTEIERKATEKSPPRKQKFSAQERKEFRKQKRAQHKLLTVPVDHPNPKFDEIKDNILKSLCFEGGDEKDKSKAGNLDVAIVPLVETVNSKRDYYTTSSCAGRSIVFEKVPDEKYQVEWIYLTHETECELDVLKTNLNTAFSKMTKGEIWFKMEPPIVSIHCRNVQAASKLLDLAKGGGLKNCGARSVSRADGSVCELKKLAYLQVMVTLVDTYHIEALVAVDGVLVVSEAYLALLAQKAKEKLVASRQRFDKVQVELANKL